MAKKKYWMGELPETCNICKANIPQEEYFVDGRIRYHSSWAIMCLYCHNWYGVGLGTGFGQKYLVRTKEKVEG